MKTCFNDDVFTVCFLCSSVCDQYLYGFETRSESQESDWIIWTNQKITLIIFWLVKNGKDWNPAIPLVKRISLVPDHIWPKTIKGQPALTHVIRNYVLLLVVPPLCLWWVTHSDKSAQAQNSSRATTTLVSQPPHSTEIYLPFYQSLSIWNSYSWKTRTWLSIIYTIAADDLVDQGVRASALAKMLLVKVSWDILVSASKEFTRSLPVQN